VLHFFQCTCLFTIDNFGCHLSGFSQGPMRIRRRDALVNVIYNALSQDHPGVLNTKHYMMMGHDHAGDVFHPKMIILLSLTSLCTVQLSLLSFLHQLHVLGWLLLLGRLPRTRNIRQLWRRLGLTLFPW